MLDSNSTQIFVVITDFNGYAQTRKCLGALFSGSFRNLQVIVVDHGTSDETRVGLERDFPQCLRIPASPDLWWAGAVNVGVRYALSRDASAVILLNNDCYVELSTIEIIVSEWVEHPDCIIAPIQKDHRSGKIISITPGSCLLLGFPTRPGPLNLSTEMKSTPVLRTKLICGGRGVIIPANAFRSVGLFDESGLPHYGADHDFYFRARSHDIFLYVSTRAFVGIDNTRTSIARNLETLSLRQFLDTLIDARSHRSIRQVAQLFRKHYPIRRLYTIGVFLYEIRYVSVYIAGRISNFLRNIL